MRNEAGGLSQVITISAPAFSSLSSVSACGWPYLLLRPQEMTATSGLIKSISSFEFVPFEEP